MSLVDDVVAILGSRLLLGLCALVLAGSALRGQFDSTEQIDDQTKEQQCFARLVGETVAELGESMQRVEGGLREIAAGNEEGLAAAVTISKAKQKAYTEALARQRDPVKFCGR